MKVLDLFSGIGGFSIGLEKAGMETVAFCEIEKYPCKVLNKHWPDVPVYNDVRTLTYDQLKSDGITTIDVICGGFPCQDISVAGNQKGINDETRSGLWGECARLLGEIQPKFAIFENVTNLLNGSGGDWFKRVLWDISQVGYDAEWHCIPASELGAHHHRDRIWIICYPNTERLQELRSTTKSSQQDQFDRRCDQDVANPKSFGRWLSQSAAKSSERSRKVHTEPSNKPSKVEHSKRWTSEAELQHQEQPILRKENKGRTPIGSRLPNVPERGFWATESGVGRVADGIPQRTHRLKCLGNAVVPQIPEIIGKELMGKIR